MLYRTARHLNFEQESSLHLTWRYETFCEGLVIIRVMSDLVFSRPVLLPYHRSVNSSRHCTVSAYEWLATIGLFYVFFVLCVFRRRRMILTLTAAR